MTPETLEALKASIAKWERNAEVEHEDQARIKANSCTLCTLFASGHWQDHCDGCPVALRTSIKGCRSTPWEQAASARSDWRRSTDEIEYKKHRDAFHAAARDEVAFLKSLLPQGEGDA